MDKIIDTGEFSGTNVSFNKSAPLSSSTSLSSTMTCSGVRPPMVSIQARAQEGGGGQCERWEQTQDQVDGPPSSSDHPCLTIRPPSPRHDNS